MHILITIFPRAEHRSLARLGRPTCPFRPASRNLINLPVASSLAPCRRSEILYPSHPLKPTSERFVPSLLAHLSVSVYSILSLLFYPPFFSLLLPPTTKNQGSCSCNATRAPLNCSDIIEFYPDIDTGNWRRGYETSLLLRIGYLRNIFFIITLIFLLFTFFVIFSINEWKENLKILLKYIINEILKNFNFENAILCIIIYKQKSKSKL